MPNIRKPLLIVAVLSALVTLAPASADVFPFEISGTIRNRVGEPLEGASVSDGRSTQVTGPDGRYLFRTITPGTYTISASKSGYVGNSQPVSTPLNLVTSGILGLSSQDLELRWNLYYGFNSVLIDTTPGPFELVVTTGSATPDPEVRSCAYIQDGSTVVRMSYVGLVEGRNNWQWSKTLEQNSPEGRFQLTTWIEDCSTSKDFVFPATRYYNIDNS